MEHNSEKVNQIIQECIDEALNRVVPDEKQLLYAEFLVSYDLKFADIPIHYSEFVDFLRGKLSIEEYHQIIRLIVRILHERATRGSYKETNAVEAFGRIVQVNMSKTQERIKRTHEIFANSKTKELRKIIVEQNQKLKDSERLSAIGQTAAMVGHDIRNPLQSIVGEIYLAKDTVATLPDGEAKNDLNENICIIEENLSYISKIVSDLQDYAKPLKPDLKQVDVEQVLVSSLASVSIPSNIDASVQMKDSSLNLKLDPLLLKRVLTNLIMNAVQAMPNGGKLTVQACKTNDAILIIIEDTGVGIPEEVKGKLFTPMFTTKSKGQGFGLAVSKRLVEVQGGKIFFESQMGKGTSFILEFPSK